MIEINFFEKEKKNILPYLALGFFAIALVLIGLYFYWMHTSYNQTIDEKNQWLDNHTEELAISREMSRYDQLTTQSLGVQETLRQEQYPMHVIAEEVIAHIPNELNRVTTFQVNHASEQIVLFLSNVTAAETERIVLDLEEQPYIEGVQFLRAAEQQEEGNQLNFELIIDLNLEGLRLEEVE